MTIENATPTDSTPDPARDVLHAYISERRPTRHRLGDRPGTEVHANKMAGIQLRQTPPGQIAARLVPTPSSSLLTRLLGGIR